MSTRSGRIRTSVIDASPSKTRKGVSPTRSPARTRKSSPPSKKTPPPTARSPGRPKSPARKSPSRKPASKFPARKSPSRTTKEKEPIEPRSQVPKSPTKRPPIESDVAVKLDDFSAKLSMYRSTRSKRLEYSIKDLTTNINENEFSLDKINGLDGNDVFGLRKRSVEEVAPRRSSRLREFLDEVPDIRRSISKSLSQSKSLSKSVSQSVDTYSDENNSEEEFQREKTKLVTRKLATPLRSTINSYTEIASKWEFGGRIGSACLIVLIPLTVISIIISCRKHCALYSLLDLSSYKSVQVFFSLQSFGLVVAQFVIQALFTIVPILGPTSDRMDDTGMKQCFNAFFSCLCTTIGLYTLDFFLLINKDNLLSEYLRLAVISYIFAVILSIFMYVKSKKLDVEYLNHYGNTGYTLYDFFMGREIHPFIKKLDVKLWLSRISSINTVILLSLIFSQGIHLKFDEKTKLAWEKSNLNVESMKILLDNVQLKPTIILFSLMQLVYILNFIIKEYKITSTFYWQYEGVGYFQTVSSALYPFYFTTVSKHLVDTSLELSINTLISASVLFTLGFLIMLISNNIKYEFRKNPLHRNFANVESMPTFQGKKLIVFNLWGVLRHPNYAGDILIHIAFALPGIISGQYWAAAPALITIIMLIHRSRRDHARCQRRYGSAWQRYCKRVPSVLIPKLL